MGLNRVQALNRQWCICKWLSCLLSASQEDSAGLTGGMFEWWQRGKGTSVCCSLAVLCASFCMTLRECLMGFPGGSDVKKNPPAMRETWVQSLGWEDPLEKGTAPHSSILAWRIPWTEEPGGYSPWGHREQDTTTRLWQMMRECLSSKCWVNTLSLFFCKYTAPVFRTVRSARRAKIYLKQYSWKRGLGETGWRWRSSPEDTWELWKMATCPAEQIGLFCVCSIRCGGCLLLVALEHLRWVSLEELHCKCLKF